MSSFLGVSITPESSRGYLYSFWSGTSHITRYLFLRLYLARGTACFSWEVATSGETGGSYVVGCGIGRFILLCFGYAKCAKMIIYHDMLIRSTESVHLSRRVTSDGRLGVRFLRATAYPGLLWRHHWKENDKLWLYFFLVGSWRPPVLENCQSRKGWELHGNIL